MSEYLTEVNVIMNYFALVDQCQNLGKMGYSGLFTIEAMPLIEKKIKTELIHDESRDLFAQLEKMFFLVRPRTQVA